MPARLNKTGVLSREQHERISMETADVVTNGGLFIGGATLKWLVDSFLRVYQSSKPQKIEQPVSIEKLERPTPSPQCNERHHNIEEDSKNMFARMSCAEQRISALEATSLATKEQLTRMDKKLDALLQR
jgi:hypothetical protein